MDAEAQFAHALRAIESYLPDLVIVGGWAHRLFRFHPWAGHDPFRLLTTDDADLLAPLRMKARGQSIHALLEAGKFRVRLSGETPPVTKYFPEDSSGFHVEFIAARVGSGTTRAGDQDTARVISGVTVQLLRYADLLEINPWKMKLDPISGARLASGGLAVRVANPVAYLAQKVLVAPRSDRSRLKQAKDVLYVHDTLMLMSGSLDDLGLEWGRVCQGLHSSLVKRLHQTRRSEFAGVTDRIREASLIAKASGRADPPEPALIRQVCQTGLERVFGGGR